jgi:hypothetical protein
MVTETERCGACRGKGRRLVRRASADAEYRLDGVIVELSTVECFKCSGSGGVLTHDALGVDPQKHVHAVPCPLGYLGRRNARVEPH